VAHVTDVDGSSRGAAVEVPHTALGSMPSPYTDDRVGVRVVAIDNERLSVLVQPPLRQDERGPANQAQLAAGPYLSAGASGLADAVVFESWHGKYAACNPRAISEELRAQGHDATQHWVVQDFSVPVPEGTEPVLKWSREYYELMGSARWIVANDTLPRFFDKRPGQTYLQTWHGTPLKRLSWDIAEIQFASSDYLNWFDRDAAQWDFLISPNPYSTDIFRRAFRYGGEMLETGYPRNDVFHGPDAAVRAEAVRRQLGIPAGKKVVLYAPTWRDNAFYGPGRYKLQTTVDFDALQKRFGDDVLVLFRGHHLVVDSLPNLGSNSVVRDVSRYPDIQDLYLVADVVLTDYSSVMFDFVNTGRPVLFFTYDLETYRDVLRGFYFDFVTDAPGPLLRTSEEVIEALADIDGVQAAYAERYDDFRHRFTALEDGKASARVIDRVFG
jgi:CDP-glycerol glycerophosphotransferase